MVEHVHAGRVRPLQVLEEEDDREPAARRLHEVAGLADETLLRRSRRLAVERAVGVGQEPGRHLHADGGRVGAQELRGVVAAAAREQAAERVVEGLEGLARAGRLAASAGHQRRRASPPPAPGAGTRRRGCSCRPRARRSRRRRCPPPPRPPRIAPPARRARPAGRRTSRATPRARRPWPPSPPPAGRRPSPVPTRSARPASWPWPGGSARPAPRAPGRRRGEEDPRRACRRAPGRRCRPGTAAARSGPRRGRPRRRRGRRARPRRGRGSAPGPCSPGSR